MPAVVLVHEPFTTLAQAQFQSLGAKDPTMLVYKQDIPARETEDEVVGKARKVAAEVARLLSSKQ